MQRLAQGNEILFLRLRRDTKEAQVCTFRGIAAWLNRTIDGLAGNLRLAREVNLPDLTRNDRIAPEARRMLNQSDSRKTAMVVVDVCFRDKVRLLHVESGATREPSCEAIVDVVLVRESCLGSERGKEQGEAA
jgi:hypothetical protein